jgi:hypothetical protein
MWVMFWASFLQPKQITLELGQQNSKALKNLGGNGKNRGPQKTRNFGFLVFFSPRFFSLAGANYP